MNKLEKIKTTRKYTAQALAKALSKLLKTKNKISEVDLRDAWLLELRKNKDIFPDGWYTPPPHGMIVVFGDDKNFERTAAPTYRDKKYWSRKDVILNKKNGIAVLYFSSVDNATGIIGDFGVTLYFGKDKKITKLFRTSMENLEETYQNVEVGKLFCDIAQDAHNILNKKSLIANLVSTTDPRGTNIGHTIPFSDKFMSKGEAKIFKTGTWEEICNMISKKRIFLNTYEKLKIVPGMAFTIEPRAHYKEKSPNIFLHSIVLIHNDKNKELLTGFDKLFKLAGMDYMFTQKINYEQAGVDYSSLDPAKKLAQDAAKTTAKHLLSVGFSDVADTRGEAAFVWKQGSVYMAQVTESLGTKNLVADAMRKITGKTYYDVIGHDTITTALNDLTSVGAKPLVVSAFWAVGKSSWFDDLVRIKDLVKGWKSACDLAKATWGGGESPSYNDIVNPDTVALGGSVTGIITSKKYLLVDSNLKAGDRIVLLKSTGINANGLSLTRAIAKKLPKGYATKLSTGQLYGEAILNKTNIYAELIQDLQKTGITIHYISNITGHGLRKIMRGKPSFTYIVEKLFEPQEVFMFIQKHANLTDEEMYGTYNMGQDYAIFVPKKDVLKTLDIIKKNKFQGLDAGYIEKGKRQVIIKPKNIIYDGSRLDLR